jgi:poly-gamma-glutamate capsule biosynthesis protein CapA/YwtB (metallophosphatase superfamily)
VRLRIGLLGDVMLGRGVAKTLETVPPAELWSEELRALVAAECDLVVANLECCLSERGEPTRLIRGKPFFFRGPPRAVEALEAMRVRVVSSANNHALDYGPEALSDTLRHLEEAGIGVTGAGPDAESARRGAIVEAGDARLGLVAVSDHPAEYAAERDAPGIAYAELHRRLPGWIADELARIRDQADLVIAFPHWGPNMATRPERWQRARAEDLLAAGADLVAGHSAHVFHGVERQPGGLVLYDLGDALDDYKVDPELRNDLGVLAVWRPGGSPELELIGLELEYCHTKLAEGAGAEWIAARLTQACGELGTTVERVDAQRFVVPA